MKHPYRSCNCGEISTQIIGQTVKLSGWIFRMRDHGGVIFVDLRDHYGIIQLVFHNEIEVISSVHIESVVTVEGNVVKRSVKTVNDKIKNGDIEIVVKSWKIESNAEILPLQVASDEDIAEELRLRYRFLDLRREKVHKNIILRSQFIQELRNVMIDEDFLEFQTPILTASSPEGARDYLVPSRLHKGKFYALPQAPQQFKQLLMVSGFDRYFQVAPCFRDEDSRADRSPAEFYQLDFEMSFVTQEEIMRIMEHVIMRSCKDIFSVEVQHFASITYQESMQKYGTDKPDLRNPLVIYDVGSIFVNSGFTLFKGNIEKGMVVRAIMVTGIGTKPRSFFDKQNDYVRSIGLPGLGYVNFTDGGKAKGPIAKFLTDKEIVDLCKIVGGRNGCAVFFVSDYEKEINKFISIIRTHLANELSLIDNKEFKFCWVTDFPLFEYDENTKKINFSHNPFSMPQQNLVGDPLQILAYQYDLVCNGIELASGAIRNHKLDVMYKAFKIAGYAEEEVKESFPALVNSFKFGAPPHGGIALGIDRLLMLMLGENNIREVICFPMNQKAEDILMGAPSVAASSHLKELAIKHI